MTTPLPAPASPAARTPTAHRAARTRPGGAAVALREGQRRRVQPLPLAPVGRWGCCHGRVQETWVRTPTTSTSSAPAARSRSIPSVKALPGSLYEGRSHAGGGRARPLVLAARPRGPGHERLPAGAVAAGRPGPRGEGKASRRARPTARGWPPPQTLPSARSAVAKAARCVPAKKRRKSKAKRSAEQPQLAMASRRKRRKRKPTCKPTRHRGGRAHDEEVGRAAAGPGAAAPTRAGVSGQLADLGLLRLVRHP